MSLKQHRYTFFSSYVAVHGNLEASMGHICSPYYQPSSDTCVQERRIVFGLTQGHLAMVDLFPAPQF